MKKINNNYWFLHEDFNYKHGFFFQGKLEKIFCDTNIKISIVQDYKLFKHDVIQDKS